MGSNKLMDPNFIVYLYRLDGNKTNEPEFVKVFEDDQSEGNKESQNQRRSRFSDNKELIDAIKDFVTES